MTRRGTGQRAEGAGQPARAFAIGVLAWLACSAPLAAQPAVSIRPFLFGMQQRFAAHETFDATFDKSVFPFWGGGADITFGDYFIELSASRFNQTGQRVFRFDGETFPLGIPLSATITPFEAIAGYRLLRWRQLIPYGGAGVGSYKYEEESEFNARDEDVDERRTGLVLVGGVEFRAHRWVGIGADVHYSRITGLLGKDGVTSSLSTELGEDDLGGVAARFKIMIGR